MKLEAFERALGYRFANRTLLEQALTHRSFGHPHNERFEFLGDSVLNFVVGHMLFERLSGAREGELSRIRAALVRQDTLYRLASRMGVGPALRLGEGELRSGGVSRPSILADALEAVVAAVFLDGGYPAAREVVEKLYEPLLDTELESMKSVKDPKTSLQEWLQGRRHGLPQYVLSGTTGEAHSQAFEVECMIPELGLSARGVGTSRRAAEQDAARRILEQLER